MRTHTVAGGAGLKLHVRETGPAEAPSILFIHGWSQHHLCWFKQMGGALGDAVRLAALDLRGHGQSEAPLSPESYTTGALWADDVAAVIAALHLRRPVLVGWSYGGLVIGDYLRKHGDAAIAGIALASPAVGIGPAWFGGLIGADFVEQAPLACSQDKAVAQQAVRTLLQRCFVRPVNADEFELAVRWSMLTHPQVRAALISRDEDFRPEFGQLGKPLLVAYGAADVLVPPAMAEALQASCLSCAMSRYDGVGHAPFLEDSDRFNAELVAFAQRAWAAA